MITPPEFVTLGKRAGDLGAKIAKALSADSDGGKTVTKAEGAAIVRDVLELLGLLVVAVLT